MMYSEAHESIGAERSASQRLRAELTAAQAEQMALTAMVNQQQQLQDQGCIHKMIYIKWVTYKTCNIFI